MSERTLRDERQPALWDPPPRDCPMCHGDGVITIAGQSVNPYSGTLGRDPQRDHDETCPNCGGSGNAHIPF